MTVKCTTAVISCEIKAIFPGAVTIPNRKWRSDDKRDRKTVQNDSTEPQYHSQKIAAVT